MSAEKAKVSGKAKKTLVIVESPSKAKTIAKFLGSSYKVIASVGHVRDLPKSKLGIDVENNFEPGYISIRGKGDVIKSMKKEAKAAKKVLLATDPDREGEAISWHIAYLLGIDEDAVCRVEFNEITKGAVKEAVKNPRRINLGLVDAQQARRVLDRLVGYQISPLLWRKISPGLSAGRVQSAALKILCDREREIIDFKPEEYWSIEAELKKEKKSFIAKLFKKTDAKDKIKISNKSEADKIISELGEDYTVVSVAEKEKKRKPMPPFTTSSLQQEASLKLNFNPKKTMMVAQQLYEGVSVKGRGMTGLVTYIRTDSVRISDVARENAKSFIKDTYGEKYLGRGIFSNKKKEVQDAHEAIRPSDITLRPEDVEDSLSKDQFKLYRLIWQRFIASQMSDAIFDSVSADIENNGYLFRATGSKKKFDGYLKVYDNSTREEKNSLLPHLTMDEKLKGESVEGIQHFTQPPARYSEAALVKELEDKNIGRPSTYAPIVGTLTERRYVRREKKILIPTELGITVTELMEKYFSAIVDVGFTAEMENRLDDIELKKIEWKNVISKFYETFEKDLKHAEESIEQTTPEDELVGENCSVCGKPLIYKRGRFGRFIACSGYPLCRNTMTINSKEEDKLDETCPECGKPLIYKNGPFGKFIACSGYPECKYKKNELKKIGVKCPSCGKDLVEKTGKRRKVFYGCSGYPACNQVYWYRPTEKKCPNCGSLLLERTIRNKDMYVCSNSECKYSEPATPGKKDDE